MHHSKISRRLAAVGHELPSGGVNGMSAKPPITAVIADIGFVGDVPQGDQRHCTKVSFFGHA